MYKICVDIGGTFTDSVLIDAKGQISEYKVPTTPADFSEGLMNTLREAAADHQQPFAKFIAQIELIVHGTTIATNALVTRNVARTAMITTRGFRDIIEIRRALKIETKSMYDAFIPPYLPLIPRYLRYTVEEETRYNGETTRQLDVAGLREIIEKIKLEKVEALAICFINSYANPENEKKAAQICRQSLPEVYITYSSDLLPRMGEYERESTCVVSACIGPVVSKYLVNLENKLRQFGFKGQLLIMQTNQLTQSPSAIMRKPVYLIGSGPAAAPPGGAFLGKYIHDSNIITADMGGTTLDAALIKNGEVVLTAGRWVGDDRIGIKIADVSSIGAGGGSIAWIDSLGLLRVGPQSAGAEPGPACYNKGGTEPTVTDAAVVLGYLPTDFFCGGKVPLDQNLARRAIKKVADPMKVSIEDAAQAIFATVNNNMADEISRISTRQGYDIRDFSLIACGGGGPMCGAFWADILGCRKVVIPNYSSSFCAWSMFTLDIGRDYLRSYIRKLNLIQPDEINALYEQMLQEAISDLKDFKVSATDLIITKSADFHYQGQYHEVEIELPTESLTSTDIQKLGDTFHQKHDELYTFTLSWVPIEISNLRLIARLKGKKLKLVKIPKGIEDPSQGLKRTRKCLFNDRLFETPVYNSEKLRSGHLISGPAIIEGVTTTVVIPPNYQCRVDDFNNYIVSRR
jgi:N-methylhydantoinase A